VGPSVSALRREVTMWKLAGAAPAPPARCSQLAFHAKTSDVGTVDEQPVLRYRIRCQRTNRIVTDVLGDRERLTRKEDDTEKDAHARG
jgi:hypothetical protein